MDEQSENVNNDIDNTTDTDKNKKPDNPSKDDFEVFRMLSAVSFSVMLIVIGIPLWWKTTEVYRAPLPYDEIHALDTSQVYIKTRIFVYSEYPTHANAIINGLMSHFENLTLFQFEVRPYKITVEPITYETIENNSTFHPNTPGDLLLVQVPSLPQGAKVMVSNKRIIYFTFKAESKAIAELLMDWFFDEEALKDKIMSILSPQNLSSTDRNTNRLRASPGYDLIFTIINSDPENVNFLWNVKNDINGYMSPLLDQLSHLSQHKIKSQWLYLMDLGEVPRRDESGWYSYSFSQLPHIITPLEKKLGSGISKSPCIHMILYVASCAYRPLCFLSADDLRVEGMISPQWGAVQILNPTEDNCANKTELQFSSKDVISIFISQFHSLLGIKEKVPKEGIILSKVVGPTLRAWELDSLYRMRTFEQITSTFLTLQSLSKLLGEISNIVINEEVASSISSAVDKVSKAVITLKVGQLDEALDYSRKAYEAAETAFSDPSLLSLLYFPDDQKYAVYIPLFLPIMIPVIMSLKRISLWITSKRVAHKTINS